MRRFLILALASAAVLGCSKKSVGSSALEEAVAKARTHPPCNKIVALDWAASWPIPAKDKGNTVFKTFFYPLAQSPIEDFWIGSPEAQADIDLNNEKALSCTLISGGGKKISRERWPKAVKGLSVEEFEAQGRLLDSSLEEMARLYAKGAPLTDANLDKAKAFVALFSQMAEPALLPYYYHLNPDFWKWLTHSNVAIPGLIRNAPKK